MCKYEEVLKKAAGAIDRKFGYDYAKRNPRVLTALLHSVTASDELEAITSKAVAAAQDAK
jgi:hypothetical protein